MRAKWANLILLTVVLLVGALSFVTGSGDLASDDLRDTFLSLRAARFVAAFLSGAALAAAGVAVQGLFRNALASPSILGTTGGAVLGGHVALVGFGLSGSAIPELALPFGCLLGAVFALVLLMSIARKKPGTLTLLLTGFILSSLFLSSAGLLTSIANEQWELGRAVMRFAMGSVSATGFAACLLSLPWIVIGIGMLHVWSTELDVLLSGESEATAMGVDVPRVTRWVTVWVSVLVAAAVSLGGAIAFVGLIVPHALRPIVGHQHKALLLSSTLLGGAFVAACDILVRLTPFTSEMPLGVVTGIIGAPVFLWLLIKNRTWDSVQ